MLLLVELFKILVVELFQACMKATLDHVGRARERIGRRKRRGK